MDIHETSENQTKDARGRVAKTVAIVINLPISDHAAMSSIQIKKMRQTGEDVSREKVISDALQFYTKSFNSQE